MNKGTRKINRMNVLIKGDMEKESIFSSIVCSHFKIGKKKIYKMNLSLNNEVVYRFIQFFFTMTFF